VNHPALVEHPKYIEQQAVVAEVEARAALVRDQVMARQREVDQAARDQEALVAEAVAKGTPVPPTPPPPAGTDNLQSALMLVRTEEAAVKADTERLIAQIAGDVEEALRTAVVAEMNSVREQADAVEAARLRVEDALRTASRVRRAVENGSAVITRPSRADRTRSHVGTHDCSTWPGLAQTRWNHSRSVTESPRSSASSTVTTTCRPAASSTPRSSRRCRRRPRTGYGARWPTPAGSERTPVRGGSPYPSARLPAWCPARRAVRATGTRAVRPHAEQEAQLTPEQIVASNRRLGALVHLPWTGTVVRGRPTTVVQGRTVDLQTLLWVMIARRPVPSMHTVRTSCGRPLCCRPNHLRAEPPPRTGYTRLTELGEPAEFVPDERPPGSTCARDHDLLDLSVLTWSRDQRRCRACTREWAAATAARAGKPRQHRQGADGRYLRCRRGHPLDGENVIVERSGIRRCKACYRLKEQRKRDKREQARTQAEPVPAPQSVAS